MTIDGAIPLNRLGLERGKLWSAVVMLIAVLAPMLWWAQWDRMVSGEEQLSQGSKITLKAVSPPMAPQSTGNVTVTVPGSGWTTDVGASRPNVQDMVHNSVHVAITAVAGVDDINVLFDRKRRDLADSRTSLFTTSDKTYHTPNSLNGLWGDLTGDSYSGALIVVGKKAVAAIVVVTAPMGHMDGEMGDITKIMGSLRVSS